VSHTAVLSLSGGHAPVDHSTPPQPKSHLRALDGYRGIAALAVVVYHSYQYAVVGNPGLFPSNTVALQLLHGLDGAVDLFFVLSAFLLTIPFAKAVLTGRNGPSTRAFAVRRAARILPLYLMATILVWAWRNPSLPGDWIDLLTHLTFTQVFDDQRIFWTIGPAWSLAVEVHFYITLALLGAALAALSRRLPQRARLPLLLGSVAGLFAASVAWKAMAWYVLEVPGDKWSVWFTLPAKLDVFALGMLLAVIHASGPNQLSTGWANLTRWTGAAIVLGAVVLRSEEAEHLWFHTIAAVGFALILAAAVLGPGSALERGLDSVLPATLGVISYSLYLWHEPLMLLLANAGIIPAAGAGSVFWPTLLVLVPASVALAWISYHAIEVPGNYLRRLVNSDGTTHDYYAERSIPMRPVTEPTA
jgi:peptidoglycan/LPS O-acetylase OafA/YrhL